MCVSKIVFADLSIGTEDGHATVTADLGVKRISVLEPGYPL
jgi:hypothetical protein